jgi:hypothetical protein
MPCDDEGDESEDTTYESDHLYESCVLYGHPDKHLGPEIAPSEYCEEYTKKPKKSSQRKYAISDESKY